ncbi:MAG: hypothetical protein WBX25_17420 [Rhodomicrobium sp.]
MTFIEECKKRQADLQRILDKMDDGQLWAGDEFSAEKFKHNARKTISMYEKIIHLLNGEQVGHA